jgi:hypothetical protein
MTAGGVAVNSTSRATRIAVTTRWHGTRIDPAVSFTPAQVHAMSMVVTGRFDCLIQAEEAMSESLLRFPREDVALLPPRRRTETRAAGDAADRLLDSAYVMIRTGDSADRRLAERTLQGRGAVDVDVRIDVAAAHRRRTGRAAALA